MTRGLLVQQASPTAGCICLAFILLEVFDAIQAGNCTTPFQNRLLLELLSFYYMLLVGERGGKEAGQPGHRDG